MASLGPLAGSSPIFRKDKEHNACHGIETPVLNATCAESAHRASHAGNFVLNEPKEPPAAQIPTHSKRPMGPFILIGPANVRIALCDRNSSGSSGCGQCGDHCEERRFARSLIEDAIMAINWSVNGSIWANLSLQACRASLRISAKLFENCGETFSDRTGRPQYFPRIMACPRWTN